jgi:regulator of cell morphogenesis and NO signaling
MSSLRQKLESLARDAAARMPAVARAPLQRLVSRVRPSKPPPAPPPPPEPPAAVEPPPPKPVNWELRSQAEIVDHIESHYHAGLRHDLPRLIERARRTEREHAGHAQLPVGLTELLEKLEGELEAHMQKEERILFPTLRTGSRGGPIDMPIRMMEREHDDHADELEQIRRLTHGLTAPPDAPPGWAALYSALATLEADLHQHIYLENNVLFARARGGGDD